MPLKPPLISCLQSLGCQRLWMASSSPCEFGAAFAASSLIGSPLPCNCCVFFFIAVFAYRPNEYMPTNWQHDPEFPDTHEWPPFFHMPVLMLMLITLLNDGTLITIGYDYAVAPRTPPKWNMPFLFSMAFVQSFVAMISSVNLLHILLHSWDENSMMRQLGLGGISYGKITSSIYLKVSVSDFFDAFLCSCWR